MECVSIEVKPRLCSCNVYMCLHNGTPFNNVDVTLSQGSIIFSINGVLNTLILPSIAIIPRSLSALNIIDNWISFHIQTKPFMSSFGSIKAELIINDELLSNVKNFSVETRNPLLKNIEYKILCACCKNTISKSISFEKIFPFPDVDYDPSEWFCCKSHTSDNNFLKLLHPQEQDYYYGQYFSIFNKNIFKNDIRIDRDLLLCTKCLYGLGKMHLEHSFKLWNCSIEFKPSCNTSIRKTASDPLADFIQIIKNSVNGSMGEEIILESYTCQEVHYLILKLMGWGLCLTTKPSEMNHLTDIHLERKQVVKTLYKYTSEVCITRNIGINVTYYDVPLPIIEAGLKHLLSSTKRIPRPYRSTGDYYIGHIDTNTLINLTK